MNRIILSFVFVAALSGVASNGLTKTLHHRKPPPARTRLVVCTMMDGDPFTVSVEHGVCGIGEKPIGGGGGDGGGDPSGVSTMRECRTAFNNSIDQCNKIRDVTQHNQCIDNAFDVQRDCMKSATGPG